MLVVIPLRDGLEKVRERRDLLPELHLGGQEPRVFEEFVGESQIFRHEAARLEPEGLPGERKIIELAPL